MSQKILKFVLIGLISFILAFSSISFLFDYNSLPAFAQSSSASSSLSSIDCSKVDCRFPPIQRPEGPQDPRAFPPIVEQPNQGGVAGLVSNIGRFVTLILVSILILLFPVFLIIGIVFIVQKKTKLGIILIAILPVILVVVLIIYTLVILYMNMRIQS